MYATCRQYVIGTRLDRVSTVKNKDKVEKNYDDIVKAHYNAKFNYLITSRTREIWRSESNVKQ